MPRLTPLFGEPLLLVEGDLRVLVAADLHIGLEHELWLCGASVPSQTGKLLEQLKSFISGTEPDRLVLLGDIKHNVPQASWQERTEVPAFLRSLSEEVRLDLVPGNHDGGLAKLAPPGVRVLPSSGFLLDGAGYFHGHTWPDEALFSSEVLVAAHLHPAVKLTDPLGYSASWRVWARAALSQEAIEQQYGRRLPSPKMLIVPAFNDLCGSLPLNEKAREHGPILAMAELDDARIYLLDGTDLGRLGGMKTKAV
jgi:metallophosphoesterase superfamily enzyme